MFNINKEETYTLISTGVEKLDSTNAPDLKSELVIINGKGENNIIVDMTETRYCDSSGLSAILVANRLCKNSGGTFVLTGLQASVRKLVSISQLDNVLNITQNINEAKDFLFMSKIENDLNEEN